MPTEQLYFEDLELGSVWEAPSRTITDAHFAQFAGLSGDFNPIHLDEEYASETQFGERVAHGMLLSTFTVVGATDLSRHLHDSMIAFLEQSSTYHEPVFVGDTVYPRLEVASKEAKDGKGLVTLESTVHNQADELVLEGELTLLVAARGDE